jgi:hypothetical protein
MSHPELHTFYPKMKLQVFWQVMLDTLEFTIVSILVKDFWNEQLETLKRR